METINDFTDEDSSSKGTDDYSSLKRNE